MKRPKGRTWWPTNSLIRAHIQVEPLPLHRSVIGLQAVSRVPASLGSGGCAQTRAWPPRPEPVSHLPLSKLTLLYHPCHHHDQMTFSRRLQSFLAKRNAPRSYTVPMTPFLTQPDHTLQARVDQALNLSKPALMAPVLSLYEAVRDPLVLDLSLKLLSPPTLSRMKPISSWSARRPAQVPSVSAVKHLVPLVPNRMALPPLSRKVKKTVWTMPVGMMPLQMLQSLFLVQHLRPSSQTPLRYRYLRPQYLRPQYLRSACRALTSKSP